MDVKIPAEHRIAIMGALELLADVALQRAHQDDELRDLAVCSEAWAMAGYATSTFIDTAPYQPLRGVSERLSLVTRARYRRPLRLLRADARGLLTGLIALADAGILSYDNAAEATRQRWLARGGHDG